MISNEGRFTRPAKRPPFQGNRRPYSDKRQPQRQDERPRPQFEVLGREVIEGPRKTFTLEHRRNAAGEFIQVVEDNGRQRNLVVIPAESLAEFATKLAALAGKVQV